MRYMVFFSSAGVPSTGLAPTLTWAYVDGTATPAPVAVAELSAIAAPGYYYFDADPLKRLAAMVDGGAALANPDRYVPMELSPDDFEQRNKRVVYTAWDAEGRPTAGTIYTYEDEATMTADTSPFPNAQQSFAFTATYDVQDRPTEYTQGKN